MAELNLLEKLAKQYGADKFGKHNYCPVYYEMFQNRREKVKKVLEIGTAEGASLFMWRDFFPNATIYGGEIDPKRVKLMEGQERIKAFECDQSFQIDLMDLLAKTDVNLDLVVDDGSHKPEDQVFTCKQLLPALNLGVIYVIEDVADESVFEKIENRFGSYLDCQLLRVGKRYDDQLIIIKK